MEDKYTFEILENPKQGVFNLIVKGTAPTKEEAEKECMNYAMQYAQDFPIIIKKNWEGSQTK